jgi:beta-glucosidase
MRIIGNTFSCSHIEPYADKPKHINAAKRADALINRLFIEPILGLGYPPDEVTALKASINITSPAMKIIYSFDFDFIGMQNYTREIVKYSFFTPYIGASLVKGRKTQCRTNRYEVGGIPAGYISYAEKV